MRYTLGIIRFESNHFNGFDHYRIGEHKEGKKRDFLKGAWNKEYLVRSGRK